MTFQNLTVLVLTGFLVTAAIIDWRSHRIPNALVGLMALCGLMLLAMQMDLQQTGDALLAMLIGLVLFLPFYVRKAMGAGDVKLMAVCGLYLTPWTALYAVGATLVFGAIVALLVVAYHRYSAHFAAAGQTDSQPGESIRKQKFPYALAIAFGTLSVALIQHSVGFEALNL